LHGAQADETAWVKLGRANLILDNLLAEGKIKPFIAVMPFGYGVDPNSHDKELQKQNTERFSRDLLEDLTPYVDSHFRTDPSREKRAIFGLSMGGGEALRAGLNNLDKFSYVAGFSAGIGDATNYPTAFATLIKDPDKSNAQLKLLWLGCGTGDQSHMKDQHAFSKFLDKNHIHYTAVETDGEHTWMVWRRYLRDEAPGLFREE
jgi:enterochelin esterase family protein